MSSAIPTSALSRTRSLRKPSTTPDATSASGESKRNVSPSRLPLKGQVQTSTASPAATRTSRSATTSAGTGTGTGTGTVKSSRPLSGVFSRITTSSSTRQREKDSPGPQASPPSRLARASSTRQSSTSTRPAAPGADSNVPSAARPTTSSGVPTSRRVASGVSTGSKPGHARAKSSVTALSGATTLRPPSQTSSASSSTTTATATADRSRPPLSSLGPSLRPKPKPQQQQAQGGQTTNNNNNTTTKLEPRPAFTTHQQHYSPAKSLAPKPLTSTFLAPPSPSKLPSNMALSAETARLQTELLQLHLLHRDAAATLEGWKRSAREKLRGRFEDVRLREEEVSRLESEVQEEGNAAALLEWGSLSLLPLPPLPPGESGLLFGSSNRLELLDEKVAMLDQVVTGLWSVVGERVMLARRQQQEQQEQEQEEQHPHQEGDGPPEGEVEEMVFIEELDASWKEECGALVRRLDEWRRVLRELPDPITIPASSTSSATSTAATTITEKGGEEEEQEGQRGNPSSLDRMLAGCRALVHGMLAELNLMEQIEREAAAEEMRWVREMNRRGLGGMDEGAPRAGAIWRVL
ncbi:uncharacterized protein B0T15DRAFT_561565 [Chaetomium strumarium]|uniref:Uncharacterized protein n=1 Tax=Chaetomium strumarium TaxID=1170767 RepID=A0AAJ0LY80_9PEZI|nr:hypothetical protein B0T15DRAFT_561565 [Chaetomium strumarium]